MKQPNRNLLYHISAWAFVFLVSLFTTNAEEDLFSTFLGSIQFFVVFTGIFYAHYSGFIPQYLMQKRYLVYAGFFLLSIVAFPYVWLGINYVMSLVFPQIPEIEDWTSTRNNFFGQAAFSIITAIAVRYAVEGRANQRKARELAHEKDRAELSALRAQANPHFLFNAFNSLYALSLKKDERLPEVILKLSDLMRYITDYSKRTQAPLADEVKLIEDYLEIQRLRLDSEFDLQFTQCGALNGKTITPLLLLPLVENCFKHGDLSPDGYIHLDLQVAENQLTFETRNIIEKRHEGHGTGLENLRRLLALKYGRHYNFVAKAKGAEFYTHLNIPLNGD